MTILTTSAVVSCGVIGMCLTCARTCIARFQWTSTEAETKPKPKPKHKSKSNAGARYLAVGQFDAAGERDVLAHGFQLGLRGWIQAGTALERLVEGVEGQPGYGRALRIDRLGQHRLQHTHMTHTKHTHGWVV
jgi:hypothetical protein